MADEVRLKKGRLIGIIDIIYYHIFRACYSLFVVWLMIVPFFFTDLDILTVYCSRLSVRETCYQDFRCYCSFIMELDFLNNKCRTLIVTLYTVLKASGPIRHPVQDAMRLYWAAHTRLG